MMLFVVFSIAFRRIPNFKSFLRLSVKEKKVALLSKNSARVSTDTNATLPS